MIDKEKNRINKVYENYLLKKNLVKNGQARIMETL